MSAAWSAVVAALIAVVALAAQVLAVRPRLARRSDAVLGGAAGPRSHAHYLYVAFEGIKAIALLVTGMLILAT